MILQTDNLYPNSFLIYSWSKSLSIPGERIGFVAAHPDIDDPRMADGLTVANRTLGFVNAPASMQLAIAGLLDITVDVSDYRRRRDLFVAGLEKAGYDFQAPEGTFYIFPKSPIADEQRVRITEYRDRHGFRRFECDKRQITVFILADKCRGKKSAVIE